MTVLTGRVAAKIRPVVEELGSWVLGWEGRFAAFHRRDRKRDESRFDCRQCCLLRAFCPIIYLFCACLCMPLMKTVL